ncbi:MAG: ABC transporter permease [Candidatus Binatia bacterium]|nr:ABC transporter permease [Candidatus Binatia bacterium]
MKFLCIFKKELRLYFGSFIAYALAAAFLLLAGYFFYTDMVFYDLFGDFVDITTSLWNYYFLDLRFISMLILPLLTMRLFAEEKKLGTIELLWTYPLTDPHIILGKFLACFVFFLAMVLCTAVYPVLLYTVHPFAWGPPLAGYLGVVLVGATFIACGTFFSSLTENQVVSAMSTYGVLVFLWFLTWNEEAVGPQLIGVVSRFSLFDRFGDFAKGVINTKDIAFFGLATAFFLVLTLQSLESRKWRGIR